ncbi:MAG: hypothetical protein HYZ14_06000 [Bacteroidetes bacterium]|nr:hypothetical protein [Bacteroidota bacterium]
MEKTKPESSLSNGLRGVVDPQKKEEPQFPQKTVVDWITKEEQVETESYKSVKKQLDFFKSEIKRFTQAVQGCDQNLKNIREGNPLLITGTTLTGGIIASNKSEGDPWVTAGGVVLGLGLGAAFDALFLKEARKLENEKIRAQLEKQKDDFSRAILHYRTQIQLAEASMRTMQKFEVKTRRVPVIRKAPSLPLPSIDTIFSDANKQTERTQSNQNKSEIDANADIETNDKLISSRQLREMNYKCLDFAGRWLEIFGQPATVFHLALHGKPGEGKSTFCFQFAHYLAENFGRVVYISGEEGFGKTLRDKMISTHAESDYLYFADCSSFEHIKEWVEQNKFHFIVIDSLDTLKIDPAKLRELKSWYPQSAFITISQSTKDGKMRGSQEIIHDADITVRVDNGTATTTKNRFKQREMTFDVFSALKVVKTPPKFGGNMGVV